MRLLSFDGVTFTTLGLQSPGFDNPASPGPSRSMSVVARIGANPYVGGVETGEQTLTATFTPASGQNIETTLFKLFALLNPDNLEPRTLVVQIGESPSTTDIETQAVPGNWRYVTTNTAAVDFTLTTPGWYAQADTTLKAEATHTGNSSFANLNTGYRDIPPTVTVYVPAVAVERTSSTATFGWKRKWVVTLTNNGSEPIINYPYQFGPVATANEVLSGFMKANGDDLRVFVEGKEWPRTLIGMNTIYTFIWTVIPHLAPGQSIDVELVYFNASATNPPVLSATSSPLLPGLDISGAGYAASNASTTTTITVTGAGWETDRWQGGTVVSGGSIAAAMLRRVASNTATVLTVTRAFNGAPVAASDLTIINSGLQGDGGIASAVTASSITDSSQVWRVNEWIGATVEVTGGTGDGSLGTVISNTATALTITSWSGVAPVATSQFNVYRYNGAWIWDVRQPPKTTAHPGLWLTNKIQAPPTVIVFDAPGSWHRFTYLRNSDTYSQPRYDSFLVGAGDYDHAPLMRIRRARKGKGGQSEAGLADAIGVSSPVGMLGIYFGYTIRNAQKSGTAEGMAEAKFMVQESGNDTWSTFLSNVAINNTTATIAPAWYDLTTYGTPNRLGMTLVPNGEDEVSNADTNTAELRSNGNYVAISINPTGQLDANYNWFVTGTPTSLYVQDISLIIRTGGATSTKPYERIVIGGIDHRLFLVANTQRIKINCETHLVTLVSNTGAYLKHIPYAVQAQKVLDNPVGVEQALVTARWLPIPPSIVDSAAIYWTDPSGAGWGNLVIGVTGRKGYWT